MSTVTIFALFSVYFNGIVTDRPYQYTLFHEKSCADIDQVLVRQSLMRVVSTSEQELSALDPDARIELARGEFFCQD